MSGTDRTVVVDASVVITLAEVDRLDLLDCVPGAIVVPSAVDDEVRDDPGASLLGAAEQAGWLEVTEEPPDEALGRAAAHLGRGDTASTGGDVALLAHALAVADPVVVTDDRPLRSACKALGIAVSGSIGVLVAAVENDEISASDANEVLFAMDEVGARLSASLLKRAEALIEDAGTD